MEIIRTTEVTTSTVYGLQCQPTMNKLFDGNLPFGSLHCVVKPGVTSVIHNHHEYECFYVTKGSGTLTVDGKHADVKEGDIIRVRPFADHAICNPNQEELHYLTFWWEDLNALVAHSEKLSNGSGNTSNTLIFSTPPTPNGDLHLGHLSGPYTGADIYRRFLELQGENAFHVTGRDDNQSYVERKALDQNRLPFDVADDYSDRMEQTLARNAVRIDHYGCPQKSPYHVKLVHRIVQELHDKGIIVERLVDSLFCVTTGRYLHEAHVRGLCPHCNAESDGNACEQCGRPNDVIDLINPQSKYGTEGVEIRRTRKLYFKLSAFADELRQYHRQTVMPAHLAALCYQMLEAGLPDICVSHFSEWGIKVPIAGYENQCVYVWFEMAAGYLAAAQETAEKFRLCEKNQEGWKTFFLDSKAHVMHFMGFDNGYYHAILFPAIYIALGWGIRLPSAFIVNELLNLDGLKFSTSRGHLILGSDLLNLVPSDYVRYYLSYVRPETKKTNFVMTEFVSVVNKQLVENWQTWLDDLFRRCDTLFHSQVPEPGAWTQEHRAYFELMNRVLTEAKIAYQLPDFSPHRACHLANELVREALRFSSSQQHYEGSKATFDFLRTGVALELLAAKSLALIMQPIMPSFSDMVWKILEGDLAMHWVDIPTFVSHGRTLAGRNVEFFSAISDSVYEL